MAKDESTQLFQSVHDVEQGHSSPHLGNPKKVGPSYSKPGNPAEDLDDSEVSDVGKGGRHATQIRGSLRSDAATLTFAPPVKRTPMPVIGGQSSMSYLFMFRVEVPGSYTYAHCVH